jgi:hypothetical protein
MLPFVTSQAIALSQSKQRPNNSQPNTQQDKAPRTGRGFFSRLFEAMVNARMRQAEAELRYHHGWHEEILKK